MTPQVTRGSSAVAAVILCIVAFKAVQSRFIVEGDAGSPDASSRPQNVLLITLDTVRADRIGVYGYAQARTPSLDALAREGTRFDDATAAAPITGPSHAAMLTGRYPSRHGVRDNATTPLPDEAITLAEVLSAKGFATGGFIGAFILDRPYGFAQGFTSFSGFTRVDSGHEQNAERRGSAVVDDALGWLAALPAHQPFFGWVHLYDPHAPYDGGYDAEIAFADQQVGRLMEMLRARGALDATLIVVTADHGESLGDHGEDEHGVFLYESVLRIPFITRGPGVARGLVIREQTRGVDLFPTVLDVLGIEVPEGLDGESLRTLLEGDQRGSSPASYSESYYPRLHYGWSELRAIRADGWKAIDAPKPELYDLRRDRAEQRNLYWAQRSLADRMIADAARIDREMGGGRELMVAQPDRDTLERLRSLGYIGTSTPAGRQQGERGADPKDRVEQRRHYKAAISETIEDLSRGRASAAAMKLRRLAKDNAQSYDLHQLLGEAYQRQARLNDALAEYRFAALLNPMSTAPRLSAAEVQLARGDVAGARKELETAQRIDAGSFDVLLVTGRVLEAESKFAEAVDAYQTAIRANEANPRARMALVSLASRIGRHDLAAAHLQTLLAMGYQPSRTHFALGRLAQLRGAGPEAERHYREALRLEPGLTMARQGLRSLQAR